MNRKFALSGLWQNVDFLKLWTAESISVVGSQITLLALPLLAALTLQASPTEMGLLTAAGEFPALILALFIGVWVDRLRRRPIMIAADLGRAGLLLIIPLTAWTDDLRIEILYIVAFLVGTLTVTFDIAYQSYLPTLVRRDQLVEGNSKLAFSASGAFIAGPGLAGGIVQLASAPVAILMDALSYLISALFLHTIRTQEATPDSQRSGLRSEIGEGLRIVIHTPILRTLGLSTGIAVLASGIQTAVIVLFVTRQLGLSPGLLGLIFAAAGVGYLVGALFTSPLARKFGLGKAILSGLVINSIGVAILPLAGGSQSVAVAILTISQLLAGLGSPVYDLNQVSLRQAITPDALRGRVSGSLRVVIRGSAPIGALLGGFIGEWFGLRIALVVAAICIPLAFAVVWFSPVRQIVEAPDVAA